jgi:hypothetical protein
MAEVLPHRKCIGADQTVSVPGNAKRLLGLKNARKDFHREYLDNGGGNSWYSYC